MNTARGEADHHVSGFAARTVQQTLALADADARADKIELAFLVDARKLRGLAADQRAAGGAANFGGALDELRHLFELDAVRCDVVQQEERVCAGADDVVDAVRREVHSCPAQLSGAAGEHELRADAVGRGGEEARLVEWIDPGEAAEAGRACRRDGRAETLDQCLRGRERDSGLGVRPALPVQESESTRRTRRRARREAGDVPAGRPART